MKDSAIKKLIAAEEKRQTGVINLIASENYVSRGVREALGSVLTNKYAEGYPGARYYGGNEIVDEIERLAQARALKLFGLSDSAWDVNVQPYSGTPANFAIYTALVPLGAKIMGLDLSMGGHLSHGYKVSATGKFWKQVPYGVDKKTERLDYNEILRIAKREKPKMIVAGFTAYSRIIDFKKFRKIADAVGAILLVDVTQGIQAQTLANLETAKHAGLRIIGALNKVDLKPAGMDELQIELADLIGVSPHEIHRVSGRSGEGIEELLDEVVRSVPPPSLNSKRAALIFSSLYDDHKGIIAFVRVFGGEFRRDDLVELKAVHHRSDVSAPFKGD